MVVQPENNCFKYVSSFRLLFIIYSTFVSLLGDETDAGADDSSSFFDGPVCVIGTTRSVFCCTCLRAAVMVSTPSDDNDDCTSFGLVFAVDNQKENTFLIQCEWNFSFWTE